MAGKNNANIGFEKQIWEAACELWGHIPAADYRKVIVGLIFLRYISFAFEKRYNQLVAEGDGFENDKDAYIEDSLLDVQSHLCTLDSKRPVTGLRLTLVFFMFNSPRFPKENVRPLSRTKFCFAELDFPPRCLPFHLLHGIYD